MKYRVTLKDGIDLLIDADKEVEAVRKAKEVRDKVLFVDANFFGEFNGFEAGSFRRMANSVINKVSELPKGSAERKRAFEHYLKNYESRLEAASSQVEKYSKELDRARAELSAGQNLLSELVASLNK